jgi:hypothetical protein
MASQGAIFASLGAAFAAGDCAAETFRGACLKPDRECSGAVIAHPHRTHACIIRKGLRMVVNEEYGSIDGPKTCVRNIRII